MDIEVSTPIVAEAEVKKYTLVGDDIYVKRYTNENIPDWYRQLISDIIAGNSQINSLNDAIAYINSWQDGYNVTLSSMQNGMLEVDTKLETLKTSNDQLTAGVGELWITKVDANSAQAISRDTVGAYFADGSAGAFFNEQISTYASDIAANAMNISTLSATVDGQTVMIEDISSVSIDPITGYMLGASKIGTAPDGSITGWQFADGTNVQSSFKIMATNFSVSDGTTGYTPFSIVGSDILFNGKVQFKNVTGTPVINQTFVQTTAPTSGMVAGDTWLDSDGGYAVYTYSGSSWVAGGGSKTYSQTSAPTSGMVAGDLWVDTDDNNKLYRYNGTSWVNQTITSGGIISAINGTTNTTTIDGGKITTGSVTADQIAANTITGTRIAADTITGANIAAGTITADEIAASTITAGNIAANTITASQIAANAITASELAAGSVTADKISVSSLAAVSAILGSVSAGSLSASKFQVNGLAAFNSSYPSNTAPMVISQFQAWSGTTNKTLTFYGASYSSGHRADRFVASTTKFMIDFSITTLTAWASSYAYIDVTISGNGITSQTVRVRSQNPSATISLAASIAQTTSISFSVSFVTNGTVETPTCTLRAFGFNTE